jgi:hypothetical protein
MTVGKNKTVLAEITLPSGWTQMAFCELDGSLHTWLSCCDSHQNPTPLLQAVDTLEEIWNAMLHGNSKAFLPDLAD